MNRLVIVGAAVAALASPLPAQKLRIVTSTTDLHAIAHAVGDKRVTAMNIAAGYQDPHFVEAKPSFALQLAKADVFAYVGLDLEIGWMPSLLDAARNRKINRGGPGDVDVSRVIPVLDVQANADRSMGDVHPRGNPHYWLHPENGKRIARLFRDKFSELDAAGASVYRANTARFEAQIAPLGLAGKQGQISVPVTEITQYVVHIAPQGSREAAERRAAELAARGVTNYYIMPDTALRWGISLGVFKSDAAAQSLRNALVRQGIEGVKITGRGPTVNKVAYQFRGIEADVRDQLGEIRRRYRGIDIRTCK